MRTRGAVADLAFVAVLATSLTLPVAMRSAQETTGSSQGSGTGGGGDPGGGSPSGDSGESGGGGGAGGGGGRGGGGPTARPSSAPASRAPTTRQPGPTGGGGNGDRAGDAPRGGTSGLSGDSYIDGSSADSDVVIVNNQPAPRRNDVPLTLFAVALIVALASTLAYVLGKKRGATQQPPPPPAPPRDPEDPWAGPV